MTNQDMEWVVMGKYAVEGDEGNRTVLDIQYHFDKFGS